MFQILEDNSPATQRYAALSQLMQNIGQGSERLQQAFQGKKERETLAERFGKEFKNIRQPDLQKQLLSGALERENQAADIKRKQAFAQQIMDDPSLKGLDPTIKRLLAYEAAGLTSAQGTKSTINALREVGSDTRLADLLGGNNEDGTQPSAAPSENPIELESDIESTSKKQSQRNYDKEIKKWQKGLADPDPRNRQFAESMIRQLTQEKEFSFKTGKEQKRSEEALRSETLPIRKEIADKARSAEQGIQNKEQLLKLIDTGNLDDPTFATLAQALPLKLGERLLSPESVTYRAGMIDEFKDLRTIFQGQTRMKEIDLLEDKIAGLYLTDNQKKSILKSRIDALQADVIKGQVAAELESEGKFGGALQFQNMVNERAKPKLEALFNRILDQQKSIIQDAENRKKISLDAHDPESISIMKQILQEAGGDKEKAKALAKKKGYSWIGMK